MALSAVLRLRIAAVLLQGKEDGRHGSAGLYWVRLSCFPALLCGQGSRLLR